jgi:hypothetical protein
VTIAILALLGASVAINAAVIWTMKSMVDNFILANSDQRCQFLDHVEHLEGLALQDAKERLELTSASIHRSVQAQSQPDPNDGSEAEAEDGIEGNRRFARVK